MSPEIETARGLSASSSGAASVSRAYSLAQRRYLAAGVDTEAALATLAGIPISLQCWQGDDVQGFEGDAPGAPGGGLAITGTHPGRARTPVELRADLGCALSLIPGRHRVNLHAIYGEPDGKTPLRRDTVGPGHFRGWVEWARALGLGLDFNPTCFAHPMAADGLTLAHPDRAVRRFWIAHCRRARRVAAFLGRELGSPSVCNVWVPDGFKDTPADRGAARALLAESLDAVFAERLPARRIIDAVEPKLFGIGAESCTVGSHDFLLAYAVRHRRHLCLDMGHFHPTESVADKLSAVLPFVPGVLLHVSRGVRWDSDHVVTLNDDLSALAREAVAPGVLPRVRFGMDYFDASIDRVAAWVIGARALGRALLSGLLEPPGIRAAEVHGDRTARLALQEEAKGLPSGAVWDEHCRRHGVPIGEAWLGPVRRHAEGTARERTGPRPNPPAS